MDEYRRKASNYRYVPGKGCRKAEFDKEALLRSMVEEGGWMTYGGELLVLLPMESHNTNGFILTITDSIAEESFFALSCMLYPHVSASL